jgi:hypothetical protein
MQPNPARRFSNAPRLVPHAVYKKKSLPETHLITYTIFGTTAYPKGLSPNGLENGSDDGLLPPLGGGFGGVSVIITNEIELSKATLVTSGLIYVFLSKILLTLVSKCKKITSNLYYKNI